MHRAPFGRCTRRCPKSAELMRELPSAGEEQSIEAARALREHDKKEEKEEEEEKESLASPPRATGASARSAAPTKASESARCALLGSRSLSLSHSLSKTERGRRRERIRLCCCSGEGKKIKKALGGERPKLQNVLDPFFFPYLSPCSSPSAPRAGWPAGPAAGALERLHRRPTCCCSLRRDDCSGSSRSSSRDASPASATQSLRQRRRRTSPPLRKRRGGRGRRQRRRLLRLSLLQLLARPRSTALSWLLEASPQQLLVVVADLDISSIAVDGDALVAAVGPLAPGLQAQAREGRALTVLHGREELHAGDGAR